MPGEEQKLAASLAEVVISDATNAATSKATTEKIDKQPSGGDTAAADATAVTDSTKEDVVDPWNVTSNSETGIDYDKLIGKWTVASLPKRTHL